MYTHHLWHLNHVQLQESRPAFEVSLTTERTARDKANSFGAVSPPPAVISSSNYLARTAVVTAETLQLQDSVQRHSDLTQAMTNTP